MADVLIRQFDVFANPERRRASDGYLVVMQSTLVSDTRGVLAGPLTAIGDLRLDQRLYPPMRLGNKAFVLVVTEMAVVPRRLLREPLANLAAERDRIVRALDFLFTGI